MTDALVQVVDKLVDVIDALKDAVDRCTDAIVGQSTVITVEEFEGMLDQDFCKKKPTQNLTAKEQHFSSKCEDQHFCANCAHGPCKMHTRPCDRCIDGSNWELKRVSDDDKMCANCKYWGATWNESPCLYCGPALVNWEPRS